MTNHNANILAAAKLLAAASAELDAARADVAGTPPPAYGSLDVRFDRLSEARKEFEVQLQNVKTCCYFASRQ